MNFLEKDLEQIIYETPYDQLSERGLDVEYDFKIRQLRIGEYGVADIVSIKRVAHIIYVHVWELKQNEINHSVFEQATRYVRGPQMIEKKFDLSNHEVRYKIILVGKRVELKNGTSYLPEVTQGLVRIYEYNYGFDGIKFNEQRGYGLSEEGNLGLTSNILINDFLNHLHNG